MPSPSQDPPRDSRHVPVMLAEVLEALAPRDGGIYIDGTFGAGGYTRAILEAGETKVVAIDRDPSAVSAGYALVSAMKGRLTVFEDRFANLDAVAASLGHASVDGVVLDVGVSSMQLDQGERGFSFRQDGPLDMRMGAEGPTAADLVNTLPEAELSRLFWVYGEEKRASALARAIVADRVAEPFLRTRQLADLCTRVVRSRPGEIHAATRAFQALRIAVNGELEELAGALLASERILGAGGCLVVVSFHSLEDRIVKTFLTDRSRRSQGGSRHLPTLAVPEATFDLVTKGALAATPEESARNPRARSAKLRAARRTAAPAREGGIDLFRLPVVSLAEGRA